MIKNYFLVAVRNLRRHKLHSSINIIGLAIGMTCCILITLFVQFELSYDTQNKNAARIHRLVVDLEANDWAISAFPLGALLKENFPEVESFTRIKPAEPFLMNREADIRYQQKIFYADATVFDILDINLIKGNPETALAEINSIVMTPERAKAYFGNQDPIGKTLSMANDSTLFQVTGIFEPLPANSHVHIDVMVSSDNFTPMRPDFERAWSYLTNHYTYLLLPDNIDHVDFGKKVSAFLDEYHEVPEDQPGNIIKLQPLTSIHLASDRGLEIEANGNMNTVYIFSAIAFFILIIACINFMNLTTAQSLKRAREVGVRKVVGSNKGQLIFQFLSESVVVSLISLFIAIILLVLIVPQFNEISGKEIILNPLKNINVIFIFIAITVFVGIVAGIYPAFFLSAFKPVSVLKGNFMSSVSGRLLRKGLVVAQFAIAFVIIVGTYIVYSQLNFMLNKSLGFDREQTMVITMPNDSIGVETIKNEMLTLADVYGATSFKEVPGNMVRTQGIWYEGAPENRAENLYVFMGDADLIETLGMKMKEGEYFRKEVSAQRKFVINETAVKHFGWEMDEAVGKLINFGRRGDEPGVVIGVIEDFHFKHLHETIDPLVMYNSNNYEGDFMALKIKSSDMLGAVGSIENKWEEVVAEHELQFTFLDESFENLFNEEKKLGELFSVFSVLAIFISCLGLFGLASFTMEQKKKSVAIHKVLGASVSGLVFMISKDFLLLVLIGMLVASPIAYLSMNSWLEGFAYNVGFGWAVFLYAAVVAIVVAFATVSYHSLKAATANPVNSLKIE